MAAPVSAVEHELRALPESLAGGLRIMAARRLGDVDEVEDVVQEVMTRAVEAVRAGRIPEGVALGAYVRGIACNVIVDVVRARRREAAVTSVDPEALPTGKPSALEALVTQEKLTAVRAALSRLEAADRRLLQRVYTDGARIVDLAAESGEPADRLRKRKSRALQRLRALLSEVDPSHVPRPSETSES